MAPPQQLVDSPGPVVRMHGFGRCSLGWSQQTSLPSPQESSVRKPTIHDISPISCRTWPTQVMLHALEPPHPCTIPVAAGLADTITGDAVSS